jgi:hypothetical protein
MFSSQAPALLETDKRGINIDWKSKPRLFIAKFFFCLILFEIIAVQNNLGITLSANILQRGCEI